MNTENEEPQQPQPRVVSGGSKAILQLMGVEEKTLNALETEEDAQKLIEYMNSVNTSKPPQIGKKQRNNNVQIPDEAEAKQNSEPLPRPSIPRLNEYTKDEYLPEGMILPGARVLRRETRTGRHVF